MMKGHIDPIRVVRTSFALALLAICIVAGCATTGTKDSLTVSGNLEKELASVTFRNRWWNNYEKAAILVRYEEYEAAELSLRSALAKRSNDSRWARTYGLHFIPEIDVDNARRVPGEGDAAAGRGPRRLGEQGC